MGVATRANFALFITRWHLEYKKMPRARAAYRGTKQRKKRQRCGHEERRSGRAFWGALLGCGSGGLVLLVLLLIFRLTFAVQFLEPLLGHHAHAPDGLHQLVVVHVVGG